MEYKTITLSLHMLFRLIQSYDVTLLMTLEHRMGLEYLGGTRKTRKYQIHDPRKFQLMVLKHPQLLDSNV